MNLSAGSFRPGTEVNKPLLVPDSVQGHGGHFRQGPCEIRSPEGAESVLTPRANIRVARIHGRPHPGKDQERHKIRLIEDIQLGECSEIPAQTTITQYRIPLVLRAG